MKRTHLFCLIAATAICAEENPNEPREISGHRTIHGAHVSTRPNPVPPRYVFGAERDWRKQPFRVATVLIEFADKKHEAVHSAEMYQRMLFSRDEYHRQPDGTPSFGSLADWYRVQSQGRFVLTGKVFDWVAIEQTFAAIHGMKFTDAREALFKVTLDKVRARDGADAFDGIDAYIFIHAGPITGPSGNILWSHQEKFGGIRYFTSGEIERIGVFCHEWGHVLGLPDLYEKEGVREGFGPWCAMTAGYRGLYPKSFCVWSKTRLGWCQPTVVDADTPQNLALRPIQEQPNDAFIVPLNAEDGVGAEFLMLENRFAAGNDAEGQAGLFIWRIKRLPDRDGLQKFGLKLPGPLDQPDTVAEAKGRCVAWPEGDAHDFIIPAEGGNFPVALRKIRLEGGVIYFDLGPQ